MLNRKLRTINRALVLLVLIVHLPYAAHAVPPEAPYDLAAATLSSTTVEFTWKESSPDVLGFYIDVMATDWSYWNGYDRPGDARSLLIEYLAPGKEYIITIKAYNSAYEYSPESATSVTTPSVAAPSNLTATVLSTTEVRLTWTDSRPDTAWYEIEITGGPYPFGQYPQAGASSYTVTGLFPNTLYTFKIRSFDAGYHESAFSAPVQAMTNPDGVAPELQAVAQSSRRIRLTWTDPTANETAYIVEHRRAVDADFLPLVQLPADATTYTHTNLDADTAYVYRVRSFNGSYYGPYSSEVAVTTPGCVEEGQYLK